jgi:heme-degrading monooxygenase HmoA
MDSDSRVVCIFRSIRTDHSTSEYEDWSNRMDQLVASMPGYLEHASFRDEVSGQGVTISYFRSMEDLGAWKQEPDHRTAQALGRSSFYTEYEIEVAVVVRHYGWKSSDE